MATKAVVLMNLGGPDALDAVQPFLFNLFYDPHILDLPNPFRWLAAKLLSVRRNKAATEIYKCLGGRSPLLEETERQAQKLESILGKDWKVFLAMRYWKPRAEQVMETLKASGFQEVVLLPLYPQYSTTTSLSSVMEWRGLEERKGVPWETKVVASYPQLPGLVSFFREEIQKGIQKLQQ